MITAGFTTANLKNNLAVAKERIEDQVKNKLISAGEFFFDIRITNRNYQDRTGDLISSTGYAVGKDGVVIAERFEGTENGVLHGSKLAELQLQGKIGYSLVVVAGMNYAFFVESKGYDVLTGSQIETETELKQALDKARKIA